MIKTFRIIDFLRKKYPDVKWTYNFNTCEWQGDDGSWVWAVSCLSPKYDGDDDTFVTRYCRYFENRRTPEWVNFW